MRQEGGATAARRRARACIDRGNPRRSAHTRIRICIHIRIRTPTRGKRSRSGAGCAACGATGCRQAGRIGECISRRALQPGVDIDRIAGTRPRRQIALR